MREVFEYSFSGRVSVSRALSDPDEIALAEDSIEYLRLNVPSLVLLRKIAMFEAVKMLGDGVPAEAVLRESGGKLPPFYSAAKPPWERRSGRRNPRGGANFRSNFLERFSAIGIISPNG